MGVIPQNIIENWQAQYEPESDLWQKYPELLSHRDKIMQLIALDEEIIKQFAWMNVERPQGRAPFYIGTCGGPGSSKSTTLDQVLESDPQAFENVVKVDPDPWGLARMTFLSGFLLSFGEIAKFDGHYEVAQRRFYDVGRPASNYSTLRVLNDAVHRGYDVAHGTTMTSPHVGGLLQSIKGAGHDIHLLVCSASDELRMELVQHRIGKQGNYQSTPEDVRNKGILLPQRMPIYFEAADTLLLFRKDKPFESANCIAQYADGQKGILDQTGYNAFIQQYHQAYQTLCEMQKAGEEVSLPPQNFAALEALYTARAQPLSPAVMSPTMG